MRYIVAVIAVACALLGGPAAAGVQIQPNATVFLNFDLTNLTPGPEFDVVIYGGDFAYTQPFDPSNNPIGMTATFFGDLDGQGGAVSPITILTPASCAAGQGCFITSGTNADEITDGKFSIGFFATAGSGTWNIDAFGVVDEEETPRIAGVASTVVIPGGTVPEPATLALLSLGLVGLGFSRRKQ